MWRASLAQGRGGGREEVRTPLPSRRGLSDNPVVAVPPRFWRGWSRMNRILIALVALALAVPAAAADKKVEDAYAKADSQLTKGRTDEAEKTMEKLVQQMPTA